jgi:hypothetical protein
MAEPGFPGWLSSQRVHLRVGGHDLNSRDHPRMNLAEAQYFIFVVVVPAPILVFVTRMRRRADHPERPASGDKEKVAAAIRFYVGINPGNIVCSFRPCRVYLDL